MKPDIEVREADPRVVYADIIDLPHWQSPTRPHMSLYDRAAQFCAYKALSGYEDMVSEEARLTDREIRPEEYELELLNRKLSLIADLIADGAAPRITFTVFVPDESKSGGRYETVEDTVRKIDRVKGQVVLSGRSELSGKYHTVDFDRIVGIRGTAMDPLDEPAGAAP